jgi:hypothetical protein
MCVLNINLFEEQSGFLQMFILFSKAIIALELFLKKREFNLKYL